MRSCAAREDTWINDEIIESYTNLHALGYAHSVEAWSANELVGGLYGVAIGGAFFGESMFHHVTGASKIALWALVERLRTRRFTMLDTQWTTPHLEQFGAREIPRNLYRRVRGRGQGQGKLRPDELWRSAVACPRERIRHSDSPASETFSNFEIRSA